VLCNHSSLPNFKSRCKQVWPGLKLLWIALMKQQNRTSTKPLRFKLLFPHATITIQNLYTYNYNNTKHLKSKVSKCVPRQAEVAQEVSGRLRPRIFLTFRHYKGGRSSAKRTGHLYPRRNPWYSLSEAEST